MVWIIVAVVLVLAIGPVAYFMPTKRDRRLTALRTQARLEGGTVNLERLPKLDAQLHERVSSGGVTRNPQISCARYALQAGKAFSSAPDIQLLRHPDGQWRHDPEVGEDHAVWRDCLQSSVPNLPEDTLAVALIGQQVSMCWTEAHPAGAEQVTAIFAELKGLRARLTTLIEAPVDDGIS